MANLISRNAIMVRDTRYTPPRKIRFINCKKKLFSKIFISLIRLEIYESLDLLLNSL